MRYSPSMHPCVALLITFVKVLASAFYLVSFPFTWTLKVAAGFVLRVLRLPPASEAEMLHSPDELRLVIQHVQLDPGARRLIDRVFDYTHRVARHVMTSVSYTHLRAH